MRKLNLILLAFVLFLVACQPAQSQQLQPSSPVLASAADVAAAARGTVYLPLIGGATPPTPTPVPTATPCNLSPGAAAFFWMLQLDPRQQRPHIECDARLVRAAENRAAAQFGDGLSHCDILGICANVYVRAAGCVLPDHYAVNGNNVEELGGGTTSPVEMFNALARSPSHRVHLFGENDFFRRQTRVGIALVELPNLRWRYYWAIIITECEAGTSGE